MRRVKKDDVPLETDLLYKAVQNYVEKHGGGILIIGGVEIQEWPGDNSNVWRIAVRCVGRKPVTPTAKRARLA
jgi:hypothetical protein